MVRHGDDQWFDLVKWTLFAMVDAEELGVTQKNVDEMAKSDKPELKRVFGTDGNLGEQLGVTKDWVSRIVKAVGNYGESFDRNVGAGSKLGSPAASTSSGTRAASSTRRRSADRRPSRGRGDEHRARTPPLAVRAQAAGVRSAAARAGTAFAVQIVFVAALVWIGYEIVANARANLEAQRITSGFGFLNNTAGFDVSQSLIPYSGSDTYTRVFLVGLLNTLLVSVIGIFFATLIGFHRRAGPAVAELAVVAHRRRLCRADPQPAAAVPDPVLVSRGARGAARIRGRASRCSAASFSAIADWSFPARSASPDSSRS